MSDLASRLRKLAALERASHCPIQADIDALEEAAFIVERPIISAYPELAKCCRLQDPNDTDEVIKLLNACAAALEGVRVPRDVARDAERYRWLREIDNQGARGPTETGVLISTDAPHKTPRYVAPVFGAALDHAIDSAMLAAAPKGSE